VEDETTGLGVTINASIVVLDVNNDPGIESVLIGNFPNGTLLRYTDGNNADAEKLISSTDRSILLTFSELLSLEMIPPPQSDTNFTLSVTLTTVSNENDTATFDHPVTVLAVADTPGLFVTSPLEILETETQPLGITVVRSVDSFDESERLTVELQVLPSEGTISAVELEGSGIIFETVNATTGLYRVSTDPAGFEDAEEQQVVLNSFFDSDKILFTPAPTFIGDATIVVTVISTEDAEGDGLASDPDAKSKSVTGEIVVAVKPDR
jgi:hypothetical protein